MDMAQLAPGIETIPEKKNAIPPAALASDLTAAFYRALREEVLINNPFLTSADRSLLRGHYPMMVSSQLYPAELAAAIYAARRSPAVEAICATHNPVVLDAGCAFGSEAFLFAMQGAKVIAVDVAAERIAIAGKRQRYYEEICDQRLDITFQVADLNEFVSGAEDISLTWIASVLAAVRDQDSLLKRLYRATRSGGQVMITDMNLLNPLFSSKEFLRRRKAKRGSVDFARAADFWAMFNRRGRSGARYYDTADGGQFDDVQFFTPKTVSSLLARAGFRPGRPVCTGFGLPVFGKWALGVERAMPQMPGFRNFGYFYLAAGIK
jgi:SAM-dependent methyltransferase